MIIRILGEGQLEVDDSQLDQLNELDSAVEKAVEAGDDAAFTQALDALLASLRTNGAPLADDSIVPSDAVVPGSDSTLSEVRDLLGDEGLIPG
ncbi:MAG TPA: hypothetical protein VF661_10255 [Actinomycetales bacterium]|jgi:hypothetical protein